MGRSPSRAVRPSSTARGPSPGAKKPRSSDGDDFGDGEAVVDFGKVHIISGDAGHLVSLLCRDFGRREGGQLVGVVQRLA